MNPSLARRVQQLEQRFHVVGPPPPTAEDLLFHEKLEELLVQMDEKHTGVVREDFAHPVSEASELTLAVCQRAIDHIRQNTPLAFPKETCDLAAQQICCFVDMTHRLVPQARCAVRCCRLARTTSQ